MIEIISQDIIQAPVERVYNVMHDVDAIKTAIPYIDKVEFLTEHHKGVGTKYLETRTVMGRQTTSTVELTDAKPNAYVKCVSNEGGAIWDSVFGMTADGKATHFTIAMTARPNPNLEKMITPEIKAIIQRAVDADLAALKDYLEAKS